MITAFLLMTAVRADLGNQADSLQIKNKIVSATKQSLSTFGIEGPLQLHSYDVNEGAHGVVDRMCVIADAHGAKFYAHAFENGAIQSISRDHEDDRRSPLDDEIRAPKNHPGSQFKPEFAKWAKKLNPQFNFGQAEVNERSPSHIARVPIVVHGHTFLDKAYSVTFSFWANNGFEHYLSARDLPVVNNIKPVISVSTAKSIVQQNAKKLDNITNAHGIKHLTKFDGNPSLCWIDQDHSKPARLAYCFPVQISRVYPDGPIAMTFNPGPSRTYEIVDAVTSDVLSDAKPYQY